MSYKVLETDILSVVYEGVEYRSLEQEIECNDDDSPYPPTIQSKWLSKDGKELDRKIASKLYLAKGHSNETDKLLRKLWGL